MKKVIIVTGASSGMGKEFIKQIVDVESGIDEIWAIARDRDGLLNLKKEVGDIIVPVSLDLTNELDLLKFKTKLNKENPYVYILVNGAGFGVFDHSENIDTNIKLNMIDLNVKAPVSMIDYTLPYMRKGSMIMNIASCAGFQPIPYINDYAATKAFLLSYSRALNRELKYKDIHVLAVTPFWTKTKFFDRAIDKKKKKGVINYSVMYNREDVMRKAIEDLYSNKDVSCYGTKNRFQRLMVKLVPHKTVMNVWLRSQKLDGTPKIRK